VLSRRVLEVAVAALTGAFGAAIALSSVGDGVSWGRAGVGAGTFPFIAGLLIVAGSLYNLVHGALHAGAPMIGWREARRWSSLFLPAAAFVAAIPFLGLHVAAGAYVFGTLAIQRRQPIVRSTAIAIVTGVAIFAVFDWAFQVTLPRGMLGAAMGY
jgi:Tripartite tricarboxylate transporter TctB family